MADNTCANRLTVCAVFANMRVD
ncbi:hypothetical protein CBM2631_A90132 [Cupriavidus taiwanensis]|nr:hypothetical protein CBM2591_A90132 [Cupriavidus taiwanensis]SOZ63546.1 hypothetical protein CBM2617_A70110 [Cupriavidus taiwanensis]SOZ82578.1 hypothetical protein CBM2618_A80111 [Cupriavidus taiwanensis]SOZ84431.1 hypothetical protein CBM2622_A80110 [Cupriavidus taiwanensis]SOZ92175.1 hypothetical protein CBM2621_A80110 [Cupriavidus taiwanensis]